MPPTVKRFAHLIASSSDDDERDREAIAQQRLAQSASPITTSDVFSSSSSTSSPSSVEDEDSEGVRVGASQQEGHAAGHPPSRKIPMASTPSRSSSRAVDGPGGAGGSPLDREAPSSAFRDCNSPTGPASGTTSPIQASPSDLPTQTQQQQQQQQPRRRLTPPSENGKRGARLSQHCLTEGGALHRAIPPPPLSRSTSPDTEEQEDDEDGAGQFEVKTTSAVPALQGHSSDGGSTAAAASQRRKSKSEVSLSDVAPNTDSSTATGPRSSHRAPKGLHSMETAKEEPNAIAVEQEQGRLRAFATLSPSIPSTEQTSERAGSDHRSDSERGREPDDGDNAEAPMRSIELVNVSAPTTAAAADDSREEAVDAAGATGAGKRRQSGSAAWMSSRRTALDQLRAELTKVSSVGAERRGAGAPVEGQQHTPPKLFQADAAMADTPSPVPGTARSPPSADSGSGFYVTPTRNIANATHTTATGPNISGISQISPDRHMEVASILVENPDLLYAAGSLSASATRAQQLHKKYGFTGDTSANTGARGLDASPPMNRSATVTPPRILDGTSPQRREESPSLSPASTPSSRALGERRQQALYHVPGANTAFLALQLRRRELLKQEMEARRMAECNFHPAVSPGTQSILRAKAKAARVRADEAAAAKEEAQLASMAGHHGPPQRERAPRPISRASSIGGVSPPAGVSTVYDRLYPTELSDAQRRKQRKREEHTLRTLAREEMAAIRAHLQVPARDAGANAQDMGPFLTNVLAVECRGKTTAQLLQSGALLTTSYQSPMSIAAREKKSRGATASAPTDSDTRGSDGDDQEYRIALFDEFLLRQNAHYFNRARTIKQIEEYITPAFTPSVNARSTAMMQSLVQRSLLEETKDAERSTVIQEHRKKGIPVSAMLVKKHKSKYEDPCTFSPQVSHLADRSRSGHGGPQKRSQADMYNNLYRDFARQQRAREAATKRAAEEALEGCTFAPKTNQKRNESVPSLLSAKRTGEYSRFLQAERERAAAAREAERLRRQEELEKAAREEAGDDARSDTTTTEELASCTFKPKTTKVPAYISRMAGSFGVVRRMDVKF